MLLHSQSGTVLLMVVAITLLLGGLAAWQKRHLRRERKMLRERGHILRSGARFKTDGRAGTP